MQVRAWEEKVLIPTYKVGDSNKNPMFLENRVYQGSSGVVYPHPVIDKVYDEKTDKEYTALYLENEYIKVMVLPELGGRIQMAYDKTNDYHFIYYNRVIKPALVGLAGPWISGGIEFNWPQHHRPSTFDALDYTIEEHEDGSKTIWVNEYEIMFRTKCALGFRLYPGKAYIELHAKLYNRTPFPQTFLWWANPAVSVDEHYQSVFPPDVHAVYDHGKRDVSSFPIATGTYYKVDYSPGTDISRYENIPVPTSYMAVNSEYNFVGGYHHQKKAGMLHIADHHISPGKKQWTWGCGEFGKAWDKQLTDNDGPYFELMCGMFTDNQPDFSWIMPNEVREFKQYFMPYKNVGHIKNASLEAMCNLEVQNNIAQVKVYVTEKRPIQVVLKHKNDILICEANELSPVKTFEKFIDLGSLHIHAQDLHLLIFDDQGRLLIDYKPVTKKEDAIPDPASPIPFPDAIKTTEELYLAGLHLEQYRHATYHAEDYYKEALGREPSDIRNNNALGLLYLRRGEYNKSESYFRTAVKKLNNHNPNPYDSEPLYNLGLCLQFQKRYDEAFAVLFKSTWNASMQDNSFLQLAYIAAIKNTWHESLSLVNKSLVRNSQSLKAKHLKAIVLRKLGKYEDAVFWSKQSLHEDYFDFGSRFELFTLLNDKGESLDTSLLLKELKKLMRDNANSYIELAIDYSNAGCFTDAYNVLLLIVENQHSPLVFYYLGYCASLNEDEVISRSWYNRAFECDPHKVFPNRLEDIEVLLHATEINNSDYKAFYYLGNFYYAKRRYSDAKNSWERSAAIFNDFATVHRNLGICYFNKFNESHHALLSFEKAFACDSSDSRVFFELDQLYKRFNRSPHNRISLLNTYRTLVNERDDLFIEYISLHNVTGQFEKANSLLKSRSFHPWEGGEGKTSGQHVISHIELAKESAKNNNIDEAIMLLKMATVYPDNLGEGKLYGAQENDIYYWLGCMYYELKKFDLSTKYWTIASFGLDVPTAAVFYNDQQPDKIFYQGLAHLKLGNEAEASLRFNNLIEFGSANLNKEIKIDYFAVSLPDLSIFDDDLNMRNNIHCNYLIGLGYLGLNQTDKALQYFNIVLGMDAVHQGSIIHREMCNLKVIKNNISISTVDA